MDESEVIMGSRGLTDVASLQHRIFFVAEAKLAAEKRDKYIKANYYLVCIDAEICPICGSQKVEVEDVAEYHEKMMEDEYVYTEITCSRCCKSTKIFHDGRAGI